MTDALVSFGGNLAERNRDLAAILANVRRRLTDFKEIEYVRMSRSYSTPAWPAGSGPDFLNAAIGFRTSLGAEALLALLHGIEDVIGRTRPVRWGPRVCDLDLLALDGQVLPDEQTVRRWMDMTDEEAIRHLPDRLLLPHPRMHRRGFVLLPLMEIAPGWRHPILGLTVAEMAAALPPEAVAGVRPL